MPCLKCLASLVYCGSIAAVLMTGWAKWYRPVMIAPAALCGQVVDLYRTFPASGTRQFCNPPHVVTLGFGCGFLHLGSSGK